MKKTLWLIGGIFCLTLFAEEPPADKKKAPPQPIAPPEFVGEAPSLADLEKKLPKIAGSTAQVLIEGETGTGKDVLARRIHLMSPRANKPFVAVNLSEVNPQLVDAALFGVKKGAFTGADKDTVGLLESANGGTLFLDELGEIPKGTQTKLLRALQENKIRPVGSNEERPIDVRIISATNVDLKEAIEAGTFREDLYFRLNVFSLTTPPLRERKEDIVRLADFFHQQLEQENKVPKGKVLSRPLLAQLQNYPWPGNIRELKAAVQFALVMSDGQIANVADLPENIVNYKPRTPITPIDASPSEERKPRLYNELGRPMTLEEQLDLHCKQVFEAAGGNLKKAAGQLDITTSALKKRLDRAKSASPPADP